MKIYIFLLMFLLSSCGNKNTFNNRKEISLNGQWKISRTDTLSGIPSDYLSKVPVPGLVDMAVPELEDKNLAIKNAGFWTEKERRTRGNKSLLYNNSIYWYKRTFIVNDESSEVVQLKINKSLYHTRVFINGKRAGENVYNFTPQ